MFSLARSFTQKARLQPRPVSAATPMAAQLLSEQYRPHSVTPGGQFLGMAQMPLVSSRSPTSAETPGPTVAKPLASSDATDGTNGANSANEAPAASVGGYGRDPVPVSLRRLEAVLGAASAACAAYHRPRLAYGLLRGRIGVRSFNKNVAAPINDPTRDLKPEDLGRFVADSAGAMAGYAGMALQASYDRNAAHLELPTTADIATHGVERAVAGYQAMRDAGASDDDILLLTCTE